MFKKILLPIDGSEIALAAADKAFALAKLAGAPVHAVFVAEPYPFTGIGQANPAGMQDYLAASQRLAAEAFRALRAQGGAGDVTLTTETLEGQSPAEQIVEAAHSAGADVIVMGSHGRGGVARLLLGSVAGKVLQLAAVPVMIVR